MTRRTHIKGRDGFLPCSTKLADPADTTYANVNHLLWWVVQAPDRDPGPGANPGRKVLSNWCGACYRDAIRYADRLAADAAAARAAIEAVQ